MNFKKIMNVIGLVLFICTSTTAQDHKYIGAGKCKMCHNKVEKGEQYNKWVAGPHSKTMAVLNAEEAKDPKCLKCHSTVGRIDASLVESITLEEGVSCESCHGPGSIYKKKTIMVNREESIKAGLILPTEEVCKKCHNEESPHYKGFNFEEYFSKIKHPSPLAQ